MIKRLFDILFSFLGLIFLFPIFILISILIIIDSSGSVFYHQKRVGRNHKDFNLLKFRTMFSGADKKGLLTIGEADKRITKTGRHLRKLKLDELPQLINILKGEMSFVGPRPEVSKYVKMYNELQKGVLAVRPGLTDYASIEYVNENEILSQYSEPEKAYIDIIMPAKLSLSLKYIDEMSLIVDIRILLKTMGKLLNTK